MNKTEVKPEVGMGVTMASGSDRYPYTIVEVRSPTAIVVQADNYKRTDSNGMSESQTYEYTPNPEGGIIIVTKRKNGRWVQKGESMDRGRGFGIGRRQAYYDFCK